VVFTPIFLFLVALSHAAEILEPPEKLNKTTLSEETLIREKQGLSTQKIKLNTQSSTSLGTQIARSPSLFPAVPGLEDSLPSFFIRGFSPEQTRVFLEEVPLTHSVFNQTALALVPMESLSSVEVYPAEVPGFLVSDGLSGALRMRLKPPGKGTPYLLGGRLGSLGWKKVLGQVSDRVGRVDFGIHADYSTSKEDFTYYDDNGTPFNLADDTYKKRENNAFQSFSILPQWSIGDFSGFSLHSRYSSEVPGSLGIPLDAHFMQTFHLLSLQYSRRQRPLLNMYGISLVQKLSDTTGLAANQVGESRLQTVGGKLSLSNDNRPLHLSFVSGLKYDFYHSIPANVEEKTQTRLEVPLSLQVSWKWAKKSALTVEGVAQWFDYGEKNRSLSDWNLSPRVNAEVGLLDNLKTKITVGKYYRAPTLQELLGSANGIAPSKDLKNEQSTKVEIGFVWTENWQGGVKSELSYFYSAAAPNQLIQMVENSQNTQTATNVGQAFLGTHEVVLQLKNRMGIFAGIGLTQMTARNLSESPFKNNSLPFRPELRMQLNLGFESTLFSLSYLPSFRNGFYTDLANIKWLPAYWDHSVIASFKPKGWGEWALELKNLADVLSLPVDSYGGNPVQEGITGYQGFPAPGRRVYLSWLLEI
jgi:iron complex outermembrane receptor protein